MAAGRVVVPTRSDDLKLNWGDKNAYNFPSNGKNFVSQRNNGFKLEPRRCGLENAMRAENNANLMLDDGVQQPPQKKRKFSPIVWDIEGKQVRNLCRNRLTDAVTVPSSLLPPCKLGNSVSEVVKSKLICADLMENSPPKSTMSDSGSVMSPSLPGQQCQDVKERYLMGKENILGPNLFTSRWASDSDDEDVSQSREKIRSSLSLESGEFEREELEGEGALSNEISSSVLSVCKDEDMEYKLELDSATDIDEMCDKDALVQSDIDVEESAGRGMNMLVGCRSVYEYERLNKISEGTYGIVYRAKDKKTGEIVALKKVKILDQREMQEFGFPLTSLREINILASFHHPSIVKVKEVVVDDHDNVYMVMEYMEHDLKCLTESMKQPFSTSDVKCLMLQLLEGVKYLHDNWVLHRDLKTSNLLLNNQGELKICDFGMARQYGSPLKPYTTKVVTMWYRAPELLLGAKKYSTAVDMWSVGCIMAEMLAKEPLFKGKSEIDQIHKIFDTLGTPSQKIWAGFSELPGAKANYSKQPYNLLRRKFPVASFTGSPILSDAGFDLLNRLLTYDPEKRITADDALNHSWFCELPLPKSKEFLPTFPPKI
ncbi:CYCLIN-DEPENDENT KINASE G2 [Hibiscus trionum]|uniref:cyclin-dependent kinase n=1 Tax=Hibiscus trionum TaxID=183268 RepID=A0A9W7M9D5_HIBTR|nr:CYCLIN-DEPENDENT KINASE G2 [Hibiscus trionum]